MIIGLTGGIASGKSTAAEYLAQKGARIIDADQISHQISQKGEKGWQLVVDEFGEEILKKDGEFNREKLGEIVFSDPDKRKRLESLLHPLIIYEMKEQAHQYLKNDEIVVFMAPLLYEAGLARFCDQVWVISCSEENQIKRLEKRNNLNQEEALKRINSQMSLEKKKEKADVIIKNNSTIEALKSKLDLYWEKVLKGVDTKLIRIALVAHDEKKEDMIRFAKKHRDVLVKMRLIATGTTGQRLIDETGLDVERMASGPIGGDQMIGAEIAKDRLDGVIFLRDPLTAQPHEPDVSALLRLCDVHEIPLATNLATAEMIIHSLAEKNRA
ncbi:dephospho-CoA kinase [Halanaerobium saccharolyticum]|uniref:Multifunctional fusion protein n=1 Tax=Halanaerobium saccharolyticum TaxID=43595 RepID=A0A4R7Z636_9FIRM|nr:dephospho-CoA kinase [Halanaerobium saccharolyticum]RAK10515.1 dephospho-CoA kinase [Halanaerobium saccharolyticum]TDW06728.1 dephospho-CoA kinase [Halanaerobium saccharolyticum]TDX62363.1 dephospho-CoA kinase [Halanaerobium saccharolyticum]